MGRPGEQGARRPGSADALREEDGTRRCEHTKRDLGEPEHRVVGRKDEIAGERELEPAPEASASDDRGCRRGCIQQRVDELVHCGQHH